MAVLAYISAFCAIVWMTKHTCRLLKHMWCSQKTQLSFQASSISIDADTADYIGVMDRQTDGFSTLYSRLRGKQAIKFQNFILADLLSKATNPAKCFGAATR